MDKKRIMAGRRLDLLLFYILINSMLIFGCGHVNQELQATLKDASDLFSRGDYTASLEKYRLMIDKYPSAKDRILFEMGIIYAYAGNERKDYQKSLECFQGLLRSYPESIYRKDSEMMIFDIGNVIAKDMTIAAQQRQIENLRQEVQSGRDGTAILKRKIETLDQDIVKKDDEIVTLRKEVFSLRRDPADKILIEKKDRRLTLIAKGQALKTYRIALGGNPDGPKERQGDNKTPEGTYFIDSRNNNSRYHLSLHISYPNEKDRKRAREHGVSPGGDIMIHGIKNGLSWIGESHTDLDWTKGCIAVTDDEIEEIARLAPNGTIVEIRP